MLIFSSFIVHGSNFSLPHCEQALIGHLLIYNKLTIILNNNNNNNKQILHFINCISSFITYFTFEISLNSHMTSDYMILFFTIIRLTK
jgi:hypothetical protein